MITDERRCYKRSRFEFNIKFRSLTIGKNLSGKAATRNISCGGMYFESLFAFDLGELLDCALDAGTGEDVLRFTSRVVRCESSRSGITPVFGVAAEFVKSLGRSSSRLRSILNDF
jgi:hypothetical protein